MLIELNLMVIPNNLCTAIVDDVNFVATVINTRLSLESETVAVLTPTPINCSCYGRAR